jgi:hypothetical protein
MSRYLVVAHQTVTNPELLDEVKALAARDERAEFVLLVPATPVRHLLYRRESAGDAQQAASKLADKARKRFAKSGVHLVDARVGAESPDEAIEQELQAHPGYAGIVISTLPRESSRWLSMDLPGKARRYGLPVHVVQAPPGWSAGDLP